MVRTAEREGKETGERAALTAGNTSSVGKEKDQGNGC